MIEMCESYAFFHSLTDFMVDGVKIMKIISKILLLMNKFKMDEIRMVKIMSWHSFFSVIKNDYMKLVLLFLE